MVWIASVSIVSNNSFDDNSNIYLDLEIGDSMKGHVYNSGFVALHSPDFLKSACAQGKDTACSDV
jgi:hypothetical protein